MNKQERIQRLYNQLLESSEVPITEEVILSKGLCLSENGKYRIYIKESLRVQEKLKVLLHEYSHCVHLTHYYRKESRAECEIIANGSAFAIAQEFGLNINKAVDLSKFTSDADGINRLSAQIQTVSSYILSGLKPF